MIILMCDHVLGTVQINKTETSTKRRRVLGILICITHWTYTVLQNGVEHPPKVMDNWGGIENTWVYHGLWWYFWGAVVILTLQCQVHRHDMTELTVDCQVYQIESQVGCVGQLLFGHMYISTASIAYTPCICKNGWSCHYHWRGVFTGFPPFGLLRHHSKPWGQDSWPSPKCDFCRENMRNPGACIELG